MITVKPLVFNLFGTNTYVLSDETNECIIIDPACSNQKEEEALDNYISEKGLTPVAQIITHYHIDHIAGIRFIKNKYGIGATAHPEGKIFWESPFNRGFDYGLKNIEIVRPDFLINENDKVTFGHSEFDVLYVPGHADGSICLVNHNQHFAIVGDVIFYGSIGRTDLETGNFEVLRKSILDKIFTLKDEYTLYPGHGQKTMVGLERIHNPYINPDL